MPYTPVGWEDVPSEKTPIDADNLNHMDEQIKANADALVPASTENIGLVKPDGETITVDADGTIHSSGGNEQEITDLKMLGWTVPKEMPIKNYIDDNGVFHQKFSRVDLSQLTYSYNEANKWFSSTNLSSQILKPNDYDIANSYINGYVTQSRAYLAGHLSEDKLTAINSSGNVLVRNLSYTDATALKNAMKGYLYYELAQEITTPVEGHEIVNTISDAYNPTKTYAAGEFCIYNNTLWKSKVNNNTGNTPAEGSYWTATNVGNEFSLSTITTTLVSNGAFTAKTPNTIGFAKVGRTVMLTANARGDFEITSDFVVVGTIPVGYRPVNNIIHSYITQTGKVILIELNPNGNISMFSSVKLSNEFLFRQCITYLVN